MLEPTTDRRLSVTRVLSVASVGIGMFLFGFVIRSLMRDGETKIQLLSPLGSTTVEQKRDNPYPAYQFSALRGLPLQAGPITIHEQLTSEPSYTSYLVSWKVPNLITKRDEKVTGQLNIPSGSGPFPVIMMVRGYADREIYTTGLGTRNAAAALARNGYVTIAPDFLGYGGSDPESEDVLIARFAKPVVLLQLVKNLDQLQLTLDPAANPGQTPPELSTALVTRVFDTQRLGMWAHSNGGQIALSLLEITSRVIPTTLWAPVSQPFPYSVMYYMNESPDGGAYVRSALADFEFGLKNNPANYSILHEPARILAPIQIHQGGRDDAVPLEWSETLAQKLKDATVSAQLFTYPQADHNLVPDWETAVQRDLQFFAKHLK